MVVHAGLVDIVRDFIVVHHRFRALFANFRTGTLAFEDVKHLVADGDSSVLFRLKERVHGLFRAHEADEPLRRGEALFDLAVGSLFHEALKFRENLYQLEVYGPKVRGLRDEGSEDVDGLLAEFEKILRAASDRLGESLRETETLLEQTRRQLPVLLGEFALHSSRVPELGLVTRFVLGERESVEGVYPEGVQALLAGVHPDLLTAYSCAIQSHLESAHFDRAQELIAQAAALPGDAEEARRELAALADYASGMQAFLDGRYPESVSRLAAWTEASERAPAHVSLARSVMKRLPKLVDHAKNGPLLRQAAEVVTRLEA